MPYAELHCHSAFSLLDGASVPEELVARAKAIGLSALALTDHDDLGGAVRFAQAAQEVDLPAIIGTELTLDDSSHLTLLAETLEGYKNICRLVSAARLEAKRGKPEVSQQTLFAHASGVIALSGCARGKIPTLIYQQNWQEAQKTAGEFHEVFGERFFLELANHYLRQEDFIARHLLEIAQKQAIPYVVTNNAHYATPDKRIIHDVLTCLRHEVTLQNAGRRLRPNGSWYLRSPKEMASLWRGYPEALENTLRIAERCQFRLGLIKPSLPEFPLPKGESHDVFLEKLVWEGAKARYGELSPKQIKQIAHELSTIFRLGLSAYFLIMWDIVNFALAQGILVQGRGSAANSAVCYCLKITAVDPIGMDLLFERFLSEGRNEPPDIDLDIAHQEREKVIQYVYEKYGRLHAAMVCEVITYRGRSAVRDTARVLGFSPLTQEKLARNAHYREAAEAALALEQGGASKAGLDEQEPLVKLLIEVVAGLNKLPRHRSIHVGGFVLSGEALGQIVPIEPAAMPGRTVIQWDKDDLGPVGLIKIDLLGLGMLTMIQEALKLIKMHRGINIDLSSLDMNDKNIYEMLGQADTVGVFQVESRAQMSILPRLKPRCFYDIIVSIAIVRPGPIQGNIVHPYLRRRRGDEPTTYLSPALEPILKRTYGVPLFQEQGMKLAVVAAGFSAEEADKLRLVMTHKRSQEKMSGLCEKLEQGMLKNGFSREDCATIIHQLRAFANYGFPESHAASFALLVFASAYLKKYFAPEFYCALLNAQPMGFYSPSTLVHDAVKHKVAVLPPDICQSSWHCTLEPDLSLRIGLRYVRGLGAKAQKALAEAGQNGPFTSLADFCTRAGLNRKALKMLAQSGALSALSQGRRQSLWDVLAFADDKAPDKQALPLTIFDTTSLPPMTDLEQTIADYRTLGLTTGKHPMAYYRSFSGSFAQKNKILPLAEVKNQKDGELIWASGGVICRQRPATAKGVVFVTLEDETGTANAVVWPSVFARYKEVLLTASFIAMHGRLQIQEGVANIICLHVEKLAPLAKESFLELRSHDFQ